MAGNGHLLPLLFKFGARADIVANAATPDAENDPSIHGEPSNMDEKSESNVCSKKRPIHNRVDEVAPLLIAAQEQDLESTRLLLSHGANCNTVEKFTGYTPIFYTVNKNHSDIQCVHKLMELLIDHGASALIQDCMGMTPLALSCKKR